MIHKVAGPLIRGLQRNLDGLHRTANEIATQSAGSRRRQGDMARSLVELQQHKLHAAANAKALQTADTTLGTLLDIKA